MKRTKYTILKAAVLLGAAAGAAWYRRSHGDAESAFAATSTPSKRVKIACVGDSITFGYGLDDRDCTSYPAVLQKLLGERYHVFNFGASGYTVQDGTEKPYIAHECYQKSIDVHADFVVYMMGTNDSKPHHWRGGEEFRKELCARLDVYKSSKIIICTPATAFFAPDSDGVMTAAAIQPAIVSEIADIVRETAKERRFALLDIHEYTAPHPEWFSDYIHPNAVGAAALAGKVYEEMVRMI